jgi:predicted Zn-dependent peptidase
MSNQDQIFEKIDATSLEEINAFIKTSLDPERRLDLVVGPLGVTKAFQ